MTFRAFASTRIFEIQTALVSGKHLIINQLPCFYKRVRNFLIAHPVSIRFGLFCIKKVAATNRNLVDTIFRTRILSETSLTKGVRAAWNNDHFALMLTRITNKTFEGFHHRGGSKCWTHSLKSTEHLIVRERTSHNTRVDMLFSLCLFVKCFYTQHKQKSFGTNNLQSKRSINTIVCFTQYFCFLMISRCGIVACDSSTPTRFFVIRPTRTRSFRLIRSNKKRTVCNLAHLTVGEKKLLLRDPKFAHLWDDLSEQKQFLSSVPLVLPTSKQKIKCLNAYPQKAFYKHKMETKRQCAIGTFDVYHPVPLEKLVERREAMIAETKYEHLVQNEDGSLYRCTYFLAKLTEPQADWLSLTEIESDGSLVECLFELLKKAENLTQPLYRSKQEKNRWNFCRKTIPLIQEKARWIREHKKEDDKWCDLQLNRIKQNSLQQNQPQYVSALEVLSIINESGIDKVHLEKYDDLESDACKKIMRILCVLKFDTVWWAVRTVCCLNRFSVQVFVQTWWDLLMTDAFGEREREKEGTSLELISFTLQRIKRNH